jgi:hypothetical protein
MLQGFTAEEAADFGTRLETLEASLPIRRGT